MLLIPVIVKGLRGCAQSRADDLRLFVEVLTTFCDDPRDLAQARADEARARQQLADAQRQLEAAGAEAVEVGLYLT